MAKFSLIPRDTEFYDLFEQETANLVIAAEKLVDFFDNYENVEAKAKELKDLEHRGDVITHEIIARVHRTFVTPIDREDITLLAHSLDDVMDFIEAAGRTAFLYRIAQPTERARELARIVVKMAHKLNEVVPRLRRRDQFKWILKQCVEINTLENEDTIIGEYISDATIILAAIDPCYCCTERMTVCNTKRKKIYSGEDLIKLSRKKTEILKNKMGVK